jgi:hypothetical protein
MYEIQAEYIPGNNQMWMSLRTENNSPVYQYETLEAAEMILPRIQGNFPEGTNLRIIEKDNQNENII